MADLTRFVRARSDLPETGFQLPLGWLVLDALCRCRALAGLCSCASTRVHCEKAGDWQEDTRREENLAGEREISLGKNPQDDPVLEESKMTSIC